MTSKIHLDHQSASPVRPEVFRAMRPWFDQSFGNPISLHGAGFEARDAMVRARTQVAGFLKGAVAEEIFFTSGGTESLNLAILGAIQAAGDGRRQILTSNAEPPTIAAILHHLEGAGFDVHRIPVDREGVISEDSFRSAVTDNTLMMVTHWGHHELGGIQPIRELAAVAAERELLFIVDAVIAAGWHPLEVQMPGLGMLICSTHRMGGPKGAGILWKRRGVRIAPLLYGGGQESGLRAGTENVPAIVGAGEACELAAMEQAGWILQARLAQARLWNRIQERIPYVQLNGPAIGSDRLPNLLHVSVEFVDGEALVLAADFAGLAIASGRNCAARNLRVSPSLEAVGLPHALAESSVLLSLGRGQSEEELDRAAEILAGVAAKLRRMSDQWTAFEEGKADSMIVPMDLLADSPEVQALRLKPRPKLDPRAGLPRPGKLPGF